MILRRGRAVLPRINFGGRCRVAVATRRRRCVWRRAHALLRCGHARCHSRSRLRPGRGRPRRRRPADRYAYQDLPPRFGFPVAEYDAAGRRARRRPGARAPPCVGTVVGADGAVGLGRRRPAAAGVRDLVLDPRGVQPEGARRRRPACAAPPVRGADAVGDRERRAAAARRRASCRSSSSTGASADFIWDNGYYLTPTLPASTRSSTATAPPPSSAASSRFRPTRWR